MDQTGSSAPGGPALQVSSTTTGQNSTLTFSGTAGQRVSVNLTNDTFPNCSTKTYILNPNGTTLTSLDCVGNGGNNFMDTVNLPSSEDHTSELQPPGANVCSVTLTH